MALITCPDCQASISDAAPACLRCGRPMASTAPAATSPQVVVTRREGAPYEMIGGFMAIAGTVTSCTHCSPDSSGVMGLGMALSVVGLLVFMVGRFID